MVQRLPYFYIIKRFLVKVEAQVSNVERRALNLLQTGISFKRGQIVRTQIFHQVDFTVLQGIEACRVVRNRTDDDFVQLRKSFFPVPGVFVQSDGIIVLPLRENKRAGAYRLILEIFLFLCNGRRTRNTEGSHCNILQERSLRLVKGKLYGRSINSLHFFDDTAAVRTEH
ncbi:hypothetical protein D3C75_447530 [compost metagenome]